MAVFYGAAKTPLQSLHNAFSIQNERILIKKIKGGSKDEAVFEQWHPEITPIRFQRTQDARSFLKECGLVEKQDYFVVLL